MKWEPIETASSPMESGSPVFLFCQSWWTKALVGGWDAHEKAWRVYGIGCPVTQPTHWMPLPPPPDDPRYYVTDAGRRALLPDDGV